MTSRRRAQDDATSSRPAPDDTRPASLRARDDAPASPRDPNDRAPRALAPFLFAYLLDYPLTLLGTARPGFHEMNPLAGHLWNAGDYATPFLLKLLGALLVLALVHVADAGTTRKITARGLQAAALAFSLLDLASLAHLTT